MCKNWLDIWIGLKNNLKNTISFSREGSTKIVLSERVLIRAKNTSRSNALLSKSRTNDTKPNLVLVMDYHPNLKDLPKLIKNHWPTLYESPRMRKVFGDDKVQIRTGFRRTKNFKDLLVPSSLLVADQEIVLTAAQSCYSCHRQVCDAYQNFLVPAKRTGSITTGKSYKIR